MTMALISSDRARYHLFARCPRGRPDLADKPLLIGVVQGHGVDKDIQERFPWVARRIPLNWPWPNQRRMAPLLQPEHFDEIACFMHATQMENFGSMLCSGLMKAGGDHDGAGRVANFLRPFGPSDKRMEQGSRRHCSGGLVLNPRALRLTCASTGGTGGASSGPEAQESTRRRMQEIAEGAEPVTTSEGRWRQKATGEVIY